MQRVKEALMKTSPVPIILFIKQLHDDAGKWRMKYSSNGKTRVEIEEKGKTSKWVTLRAFSVIKKYYAV